MVYSAYWAAVSAQAVLATPPVTYATPSSSEPIPVTTAIPLVAYGCTCPMCWCQTMASYYRCVAYASNVAEQQELVRMGYQPSVYCPVDMDTMPQEFVPSPPRQRSVSAPTLPKIPEDTEVEEIVDVVN